MFINKSSGIIVYICGMRGPFLAVLWHCWLGDRKLGKISYLQFQNVLLWESYM